MTGGFETFNYKRYDGADLTADVFATAIDALPVFSERTLIEIVDFDLFRCSDDKKEQFIELFADLPDYVCVVFVYDTIEFRPDNRLKQNQALRKLMHIVEFEVQEQSDLVVWIGRRYKALGKKIDRSTAEYLAFVTGGLMTNLVGEIEKTAALSAGVIIDRETIDKVVTPVLDAVTYRLGRRAGDRPLRPRLPDAVRSASDAGAAAQNPVCCVPENAPIACRAHLH